MSETITTKNKFEAVYYMAHGFAIHSITFVKENGGLIPVFQIKGDDLNEVKKRIQLGRAILTLTELESNLARLEKTIKNELKFLLEGNGNGK